MMRIVLFLVAGLLAVVEGYVRGPRARAMTMKADAPLVFAGVKFSDPIANSLRTMGITEPTPIQKNAIVAITTGLSCILHAETGSGKTLCYLLPLLKRMCAKSTQDSVSVECLAPNQALIVVPTKELAVQVAADVASLLSADSENIDCSMVHLCIGKTSGGLGSVKAPIVVGTPYKLLDVIAASPQNALDNLEYLVLDEVDKMLPVASKYADAGRKRAARQDDNAVEALLSLLVQRRGFEPPDARGVPSPNSPLQVVAASATIGRPLRRELYRTLLSASTSASSGVDSWDGRDSNYEKKQYGELPLIRADDEFLMPAREKRGQAELVEEEDGDEEEFEGELEGEEEGGYSLEDLEAAVNVQQGTASDTSNAATQAQPQRQLKSVHQQRKIGIPASIRHVAVLVSSDSAEFSNKLSVAKKLWVRVPEGGKKSDKDKPEEGSSSSSSSTMGCGLSRRGLLFVPKMHDVKQAMGMLGFMGLSKQVRDLQQILGVEAGEKQEATKRWERVGYKGGKGSKKQQEKELEQAGESSTEQLVLRAARSKLGAASRLGGGEEGALEREGEGDRELYIVPVSGMRGLHLQDVESVIITVPPKSMDEYLHVAGRTGRAGNTVSGTVVSLVNYEELKRMQSWQTALNIEFEVTYEDMN